MADKYYRLVSFVVNICPQTLRELFVKYMKADITRLPTCTTLGAYLASRKPQLQILRRRNVVRQNQWNLLYPQNGQVDESSWDTTLVILLIYELFQVQLQKVETDAVNDIRGVRYRLEHITDTSITDVDFENMWNTLETATICLARQIHPSSIFEHTIKEVIDDTKINNMPTLGDTLRYWYEHTIFKLQCDLEDMKETMLEMLRTTEDNLKYTTDCRTILQGNVVTKVDSLGNKVKRMKTVDHILANMNHTFITTMKEDLRYGFQSPQEIADIKTKLRDMHHVIVTGIRGSRYLETALAAIQDFGYNLNRCVEMRSSSDWRHIDPEEVDLVLCKEPFGDFGFDENRAKSMVDIFDSMHKTAKPTDGSKFVAIVIVSDLDLLHNVSNIYEHDLLENVVHVYQQTSANNPEDLTVSCRDREVGAILNNLLEVSGIFMETHNNNLHSKTVFDEAKAKFKTNKVITITGPRKCGKTSLAIKLSSAYQPHQILILKKPEDMKFVDLSHICLIIIDDFPGKYRFEKARACAWLEEFEILNSIVRVGKLNAIVTCEETLLQKCNDEFSSHPFLENKINVKGTEIVVKCERESTEISSDDEDMVCNEANVPDDQLDTTENSSTVNQSDKNQPMSSFTAVKMVKNVDVPPPKERDWLDFCRYIDGTYMFLTEGKKEGFAHIYHFSSDFKIIHQYQTDISAYSYTDSCICCTDAGEIVVASEGVVHLCRIADETIQIVKKEKLYSQCSRLWFFKNRIRCLLFGTNNIEVFDKYLNKKKTVTLYRMQCDKEIDDEIFCVSISNQTYVYNNYDGDVVIEDPKQKQLKYLHEKGFKPLCACTASFDSVFVLGIQDEENSRILQVNTKAEILTDILMGNDELTLKSYSRYESDFDASNSRLVLLEHCSNKIREINGTDMWC